MGATEQARAKIESELRKITDSDAGINSSFLLLHSDKYGVHWNMAYGRDHGENAHPDQPYPTASVGKAFTALIVAMFAEEGKLGFHDPISNYLPQHLMSGLHVYKGKDYSQEIRISHLISNTSGLPDYYEEKTSHGRFYEVLLREPDRTWKPEETIQWSKEYLKPRFAPGKGVHYSNTGFNLLGLIIEQIAAKPYQKVLHERIFDPLHMDHSFLSGFSKPALASDRRDASVHYMGKNVRITDYPCFSSIYSSGQTVSTSEDLLKFM